MDALGGAPGVWSARYAGLPSNDENNNQKLLEAMKAVEDGRRTARYRCVAAFVDQARGVELWKSGACEGVVLRSYRGSGGFGYTVGRGIGYGYVRHPGVERDWLLAGQYQLEVATERVEATLHLAPLYDPGGDRTRQ